MSAAGPHAGLGAAARDPVIDTLRGVAILAVLALHFSLSFGLTDSWLGDLLPRPWLGRWINNGNYGVTIFFVISGYLITAGLLAHHGGLARLDLRRFYLARASRILPPLLLALLIIVPLGLAGVPGFNNADGGVARPASFWWPVIASLLGFWHNQLMQSAGYFNYSLNVYWSLSVEEVFYLAFPLACLMLRRERWVAMLCVCLMLLGPWFRSQHADNEINYLYAYPACFDALAAGVLCALVVRRSGSAAAWAVPVSWGVALAMAGVWWRGFGAHPAAGFSAMAVLTATLLWLRRTPSTRRQNVPARALQWLGAHSYELYLFHIIVLAGLRLVLTRADISHDARLPLFVAFVLVSAGVAAVVSRYFAQPAKLWLRAKGRATLPTVAPAV